MGKMVNCKACGKELATGVKKCVNCGKDQRNFFMKHKILTGVIVLGLFGSIVSLGNDDTNGNDPVQTSTSNETVQKEEVAVTVSAVDLATAYEENEVKADKDYKGKLVEITGAIDSIDVMAGQTFIVLSAGKDFALTQAQCFFADQEDIDKIAEMKKGDTVTLTGVVDGKSINVGVNDCKLK